MYRFSSEVVRKVLLNEILIARIVVELEYQRTHFCILVSRLRDTSLLGRVWRGQLAEDPIE